MAANRRRAVTLVRLAAVVPAVLLGVLLWVSVSPVVGVVAFVVAARS